MSSVTARIRQIKQPYGGYLRPSEFKKIQLDDGKVLYAEENIHSSLIGMVVDYMVRFINTGDINKAFEISIKGYNAKQFFTKKDDVDIYSLLKKIKGIDKASIISACKAVTFDVWYRNPIDAMLAKGVNDINPDNNTIHNIKIMIERSISFWKKYGKIKTDGFVFAEYNKNNKLIHNGYSKIITAGDGDYLTKDTMWDFKVIKKEIESKHTLQLLIYWIMGKHSKMKIFKNITKIGIFNPRKNRIYLYDMHNIDKKIIKTIEKEVICY